MQLHTGPQVNGPRQGNVPSTEPSQQGGPRIEVLEDVSVECAKFERSLADMTSRLSNAPDSQFDEILTGCLRTLVETLGFDRGTLMAFSEHGRRFQATHSWAVEGVPLSPTDALIDAELPWYAHQIRSGYIVSISSSMDLPAAAARERAFLLKSGLKSNLSIPLLMEGTIVGAVAFGSFKRERRWPPELISRLRLAGEILALGMRRHQYAQALTALAQTVEQVSVGPAGGSQKRTEQLRQRSIRLLQAEHQERRRMGQVLHEDIMQTLSAAGMFMQSGEGADEDQRLAANSRAMSLLKESLQKLRQLAVELRPEAVWEMGAEEGFRWLANQMRRRYDLDVELHIDKAVESISKDMRPFLYDSARKLLDNVAVHSGCKRARLDVQPVDPNCIRLTVSDEGVGFNPASSQDLSNGLFGLFSIREQVDLLDGTLEVRSAPGQGTRAAITVPLGR
jgi:signal transduction histidine kinase